MHIYNLIISSLFFLLFILLISFNLFFFFLVSFLLSLVLFHLEICQVTKMKWAVSNGKQNYLFNSCSCLFCDWFISACYFKEIISFIIFNQNKNSFFCWCRLGHAGNWIILTNSQITYVLFYLLFKVTDNITAVHACYKPNVIVHYWEY